MHSHVIVTAELKSPSFSLIFYDEEIVLEIGTNKK